MLKSERYSKEWKEKLSKAGKKAWKTRVVSPETRQKFVLNAIRSAKLKKGKEYVKTEDLKSFVKVRARIFEKRGRKCERCGWAVKNKFNGFIPVQIDHIDGNRKNNKDSNLIILCPNCHSLTEKFMFYGQKRKGQTAKVAVSSPKR